MVSAYKNLKHVERDFRHIKADLDLRLVFHRLEERIKAHVLICMLASYLDWRLRQAWSPLTFTDQNPSHTTTPSPPPAGPRPPGPKPHTSTIPRAAPYRSFRGVLEHLATLTRNHVRFAGRQGYRAHARRTRQRPGGTARGQRAGGN